MNHSTEDPKKKFRGGADLREEAQKSAPKLLDDAPPTDPRKKLDRLREGLTSLGVDEAVFDKVWGRLAAQHGDLEQVVKLISSAMTVQRRKIADGEDVERQD